MSNGIEAQGYVTLVEMSRRGMLSQQREQRNLIQTPEVPDTARQHITHGIGGSSVFGAHMAEHFRSYADHVDPDTGERDVTSAA